MPALTSISINYLSNVSIPFNVSDSLGRLAGKRITLSIGSSFKQARILSKSSGLGIGSSDVEFNEATPFLMTGWVKLTPADYAILPPGDYKVSLWVDDGVDFQQCVTAGGSIPLTVRADVPRT